MLSRKWCSVLVCVAAISLVVSACAPAQPEVVEVEKQVAVEKPVVQTVIVEKEVAVEKTVIETVVVEKEVEKVVEKVVTPTPAPRVPTGQLVIAANLEPARNLHPWMVRIGWSHPLGEIICEPLVRRGSDPGVTITPALAESWETSADGKTWTFHIRKGVAFQDGTPLTADDVVYSIQGLLDFEPSMNQFKPYLKIAEVKKVDDYTVQLIQEEAYSPILASLTFVPIGPKHLMEGQDPAESTFSRMPVGTGPYKIVSHELDDITLEVNENYWGKMPGIKTIYLKSVPDTNAQAAMLRSGEADLAVFVPTTMDGMQYLPGWAFKDIPSMSMYNFIVLTDREPFNDVKVRQAMMHALDRKGIIAAAWAGKAMLNTSPLPPTLDFYNPDVAEYAYDLDMAKSLLTEAGWADTNGDGILDKNGQPFQFMIHTQPGMNADTAAIAQQNWKAVGMDVDIQVVADSSIFLAGRRDREYLIYVMHTGLGLDPMITMEGTFMSGKPNNWSNFSNAEYDAIAEKALKEADRATWTGLVQDLQTILAEEVPYLWIGTPISGILYKDTLKGLEINAFTLTNGFIDGVRDWYLEE